MWPGGCVGGRRVCAGPGGGQRAEEMGCVESLLRLAVLPQARVPGVAAGVTPRVVGVDAELGVLLVVAGR